MKYGTLSLLVIALSLHGCAVSLPEKPSAPMVVVAVESDTTESTPEIRDREEASEDLSVLKNTTMRPVEPEQGTEYAFVCQSYDYRNGWRSGVVTINEPWDQPFDSFVPVPVLDFDVLANEAKRRFESRRDELTGQPVVPRTVCSFQGLTMKSLEPVLP